MGNTALYWIDGRWQSLEVDNADNLDGKDSLEFSSVGHKHFKSEITDLPGNATTTQDGFMSAGDKTKLNGIAVNANNYVHPNDVNTRHVTDAEKATWNAKANASHPHTIANITGLQAELDSIKAMASGGLDKVPSNNWKITPQNISFNATHNFKICVGHIKLNYLDAIRVNLATHNINLHTSDGTRTAYLSRDVLLYPMTEVGKPAVGDTSTTLSIGSNAYLLANKYYTIEAAQASTAYSLEGGIIDAIPLTKDKLNPGYYAVFVSYSVGNQSGTKYTAFSAQSITSNLYIGYDE